MSPLKLRYLRNTAPAHIIVTCIRRAEGNFENPYTSITNFGWADEGFRGESGIITRERMHEFVTDGGKAFIKGPNGEKIFLVAGISPDGTKFVRTETDIYQEDLLLQVKGCK